MCTNESGDGDCRRKSGVALFWCCNGADGEFVFSPFCGANETVCAEPGGVAEVRFCGAVRFWHQLVIVRHQWQSASKTQKCVRVLTLFLFKVFRFEHTARFETMKPWMGDRRMHTRRSLSVCSFMYRNHHVFIFGEMLARFQISSSQYKA